MNVKMTSIFKSTTLLNYSKQIILNCKEKSTNWRNECFKVVNRQKNFMAFKKNDLYSIYFVKKIDFFFIVKKSKYLKLILIKITD